MDKWYRPNQNMTISFDKMIDVIRQYTNLTESDSNILYYQVVVATDSQTRGSVQAFTRSVSVRRMIDENHGKGGIYFYNTKIQRPPRSIYEKMMLEAGMTLELATRINDAFKRCDIQAEIHLHFDVSRHGQSNVALKPIVGMANGSGFKYFLKPDSWGASCVSDRHSK